jgi:anaerobic magnesium-protoporphyrin IX monomethyl ester cyclase
MTAHRVGTLLISPPPLNADGSPCDLQAFCPHLGIVSLATTLRANGEEVHLLDAATFADVEAALAAPWAVVGVTCFTAAREAALRCAELAKTLCPQAVVLLGGPHATAMAHEILVRCPSVDAVVAGEGETALLRIVREPGRVNEVPGVVFRNPDGTTHANPASSPVSLRDLPFPDLSLLDMKRYLSATNLLGHKNSRWIHFITARGCPGQCIFCATPNTWGQQVRRYDLDAVIDRLEVLKSEHEIEGVFFFDDTFNSDAKWVEAFCQRFIERRVGIPWWCIGRVDTVTEGMLSMMRRAGCLAIKYGVECGSERMLRRIGKNITISQVRRAIAQTRSAGILAGAGFIVGLPGETVAEMHTSVDLLVDLDVDMFSFNTPWLFPGTSLFRIAKSEGKIDEDYFFQPVSAASAMGTTAAHPCRRQSLPIYYPGAFTELEFLEFSRRLHEEVSSFYESKFKRLRDALGEGLMLS